MTPEDLPSLVNGNPMLRRWGRFLDADVLLAVGTEEWMLRLRDGAVESVRHGPFLMPSWTLAIRIELEAWQAFLSPEPPPGRHDLMALLRGRELRLEGNLHPFMSHLLWFKAALATLRSQPARAAA
ncbi:hypothetical protein [Sabulicella glaciei]|uniref:SCP2 domain-containing protein n=1 Tax=Sabulicella glaciei TaxID=2984948 RepID=A0ABT3P1C8_9PROT|nr:hypothetical protein [Roseococcus sp. MDT2-1-1]MCW8088214.1 hypothetical protein [Roseococcus sp. MDT2-1-1]